MLVFSAPEKHNHELQARIRNSRKGRGKGWKHHSMLVKERIQERGGGGVDDINPETCMTSL